VLPQSWPSMSGRSRGHGNSRRGWWAGEWQDDSTANGGRDSTAQWWGHGAWWGGGAHAAWWSVPLVHGGGTTPIVQAPDTDLHQMSREGLIPNRTPSFQTPDTNLNQITHSQVATGQMTVDRAGHKWYTGAGNSRRDQAAVGNAGAPTAVAAASLAQPLDTHSTQVASQPKSALKKPVVARSESSDSVCQEIFTLEYFQKYYALNHVKTYNYGGCNKHNHALKYCRHNTEKTGCSAFIFDNTNPFKMKQMVIGSPTDWKFIGDPTIEWNWQEMVAQLDAESLAQVVEGQSAELIGPNRSRGLVSCRLQKTDRNDQIWDMMKLLPIAGRIAHTEEKLMVWDFVLERIDGTEVWLHPCHNNPRVNCLEPGGPDSPLCPHVRSFGEDMQVSVCKYCWNQRKHFQSILHFKGIRS
jgi:hypothetical protein